jgi:hypothetical protein
MKFIHTTKTRYNHPQKSELENDLLYEIRLNNCGDWYGTAYGWLFSICDYLYDHDAEIPEDWDYRRGCGSSDTEAYEYESLQELAGNDYDTIIKIGNTLSRLINRIKSRGDDY